MKVKLNFTVNFSFLFIVKCLLDHISEFLLLKISKSAVVFRICNLSPLDTEVKGVMSKPS